MTKQTPRDSALGFLSRLSNDAVRADFDLADLFSENHHFDYRDRSFVTNLVQGVLRWRLRLDWIIEQYSKFPLTRIDSQTLEILRLAIYQIVFLDRVPDSAAVNEAVEQSKKWCPRHVVSFVNAVLRRISSQKENFPALNREEDPLRYLSVQYSYPSWLIKMWTMDYGLEFTEELLSAQNQIPHLVIRANVLKTTRDELEMTLEGEGAHVSRTQYAPEGLILNEMKGNLEVSIAFRKGLFQVQDQAAQIAAYLLSPKPGETVLDVCAGLGGKTSHLAELMTNKGCLLALDISHWRLLSLMSNAQHHGIKIIKPVVFDARAGFKSLFRVKFDRILVDAPCSGLGVLSRHPDGKWNRTEADIMRLASLQQAILEANIPVLREGGRMLYMTCTISRRENEGLVELLLKENQNIKLLDLRKYGPKWCQDLIDDQGFYRTWPHIHGMDGFFGALFEKIK